MQSLSIDVGIRNLACCLLHISEDGKQWEIIDWFVLDLFEYTPPTKENATEDLISIFKSYKKWKKEELVEFVHRHELAVKNEKRESFEMAIQEYLKQNKITNTC